MRERMHAHRVQRCSGLKARSLCDGGSITCSFVTTRKLLARCGARMPLLLEFDFQKLRPYPTSQKALNPALFCLIFACVVRPYRCVATTEWKPWRLIGGYA